MDDTATITAIVFTCTTVLVVGAFLLIKSAKRAWKKCSPHIENIRTSHDAPADEWDQASIFYRVPGSALGFLILEYLVLWVTIGLSWDENDFFSLETLIGPWLAFVGGLDSVIGIIGAVGVLCSTIYGIYQDLPGTRMKTLAALGLFGIMLGLGVRFS